VKDESDLLVAMLGSEHQGGRPGDAVGLSSTFLRLSKFFAPARIKPFSTMNQCSMNNLTP
jgi:hypothetical protein